MKEIEGAALAALIGEAEAEYRATKIKAAKQAIVHMASEIERNESAVRNAEEQLASAKKKLEAARGRYEQAKAGNWTVLPTEDELNKKSEDKK